MNPGLGRHGIGEAEDLEEALEVGGLARDDGDGSFAPLELAEPRGEHRRAHSR